MSCSGPTPHFDQSGYLDHALASPSMADAVSGAAFWHINADEPVALDYNTEFNPPLLYQPHEFRSSDHDTAGCSCEQIVEEQGLGLGHRKFGCSVDVMREWVTLMTNP